MRAFTRRNLLLTIFLVSAFFVIDVRASAIAKRAVNSSEGDGDTAVALMRRSGLTLRHIPIFGAMIENILDMLIRAIQRFETRTNGLLSKIIHRVLPCCITEENGLLCSGVERNGGPTKIFLNSLDDVPTSVMPDLAKWLIRLAVERMLESNSTEETA